MITAEEMAKQFDELSEAAGNDGELDRGDVWREAAAKLRKFIQSRAAGVQGADLTQEAVAEAMKRWPDAQPAIIFMAGAVGALAPITANDIAWANTQTATPQPPKPAGAVPLRVAILSSHDDPKVMRVIALSPGQSEEFDDDSATRRWVHPFLKGEWHLRSFVSLEFQDGDAREAAGRAGAVPAGWREFLQDLATSKAGVWSVDTLASKASSLLAAAPGQHPPAEPETTAADNDLVQVERGLLGAACSAIAKKRDAPKVLEALRKITMTPRAELADSLFVGAVKKLVIASRTSGGTAGRDDGLCAALDAVEAMLAEPAARAQVGDLDSVMRARGLPCVSDALGYSRNFAYANPALSQTTRDHIEGLCNMLEIAAANPSPAHAGAGAEALRLDVTGEPKA